VQGHGGVSGIESDIAVFSDSLDTHPEQSLQSVMDCVFGKPECLKNLTNVGSVCQKDENINNNDNVHRQEQ